MNVGFGSFSSDIDIAGISDQNGNNTHHHPKIKPSPLATTSPLTKEEEAAEIISPTIKPRFDFQKRIFLTIALYLAFMGTGFSGGIIGPTLVHLEYLFDTDTSGISKTFIGLNFGFLIGTFLCAAMFDRMNQEIQFAFWGTVLGLCCMTVPWVPSLSYYYGIVAVQYLAQGVVYSGGQSYVIKLWKDYGKKGPALLGIYMSWSLGAFLAPFVAMPFLEELDDDSITQNQTTYENGIVVSANHNNNSLHSIETVITEDEESKMLTGIHKVKYIYAIVGFINNFAAVLFFIGFLIKGPTCKRDSQTYSDNNNQLDKSEKISNHEMQSTTRIKISKCVIIFLVWLFAVLYFWHEYSIGCYISAFCLKGLNWPVEQSALVTSIFFGFLGIGRILGIPVAKFLSPTKMLFINICLTTTGLALLLLSQYTNIIVWIGVAMAGYGMSTTSPSYVLWTSNYMAISGPMGAMFMAGSATGSMTAGGLVGYLFQEYTHMWVVYISLGSSVLNIAIFAMLQLTGRYLRRLQQQLESKGEEVNGNCEKKTFI